jgi:uncharacterized membrane protein
MPKEFYVAALIVVFVIMESIQASKTVVKMADEIETAEKKRKGVLLFFYAVASWNVILQNPIALQQRLHRCHCWLLLFTLLLNPV